MEIKIAVCDDESIYCTKIRDIIHEILKEKAVDVNIFEFNSGRKLLESVADGNKYDVYFLDVDMGEINGIQIAKEIRIVDVAAYIVFITAFITYALEGYTVKAIRYILKDDRKLWENMKECMDTIFAELDFRKQYIEFDNQGKKIKVHVDGILYVESRLHKMYFLVLDKETKEIQEYYKFDTLENIQQMLAKYGFKRVHQSFIVNMRHVKSICRYEVCVSGDKKISVSKRYYKEVEREYLSQKGMI